MRFTLTAAAKEAGVSKGTISKALKSGRLSGDRQEDGSFQIDASELFRVYPRKPEQPVAETVRKPMETAGQPMEMVVDLAVLRVELAREREERVRERETAQETIADLRKRLDRAEDRILALSAPERPQDGTVAVETPAPISEKPQEPDRSQEEAESLQKRLEWAEARMLAAVRALEHVQDRSAEAARAETPVRVRTGLLAWFRRR